MTVRQLYWKCERERENFWRALHAMQRSDNPFTRDELLTARSLGLPVSDLAIALTSEEEA